MFVADHTWDRKELARFEESASAEVTGWDPVANRLVFELCFKQKFGLGEKDESLVEKLGLELEIFLNVLEAVLSRDGRKWMAADVSQRVFLLDLVICSYSSFGRVANIVLVGIFPGRHLLYAVREPSRENATSEDVR